VAPIDEPIEAGVQDPGTDSDPNGGGDSGPNFVEYDVADVGVNAASRQDIANYVLGKLRERAVGLMLNKIGMGGGSSGELDQVLKQLQQIKEQLTRTLNELQGSIAASALNAKVTATIEDMATIRVTLDRYENIARLEKDIALARERGDAGAATTLSYGMEDRVQEFVSMFDAGGRMALALERLHLIIAGTGFGEENLIDLYRWKLRSSGRNLTNAHSVSLAHGLTFFEEYEAIAGLLTAECNAAVQYGNDGTGQWPKVRSQTCSRDPQANQRLEVRLETYVGDQRAKLPMVIPPGMLIDQGASFSGINDTTTNKPFFFSVDGNYPVRPKDTAATPGSAKNIVANIQQVGVSDLRLPSNAELRPVFNGNPPGQPTGVHLNRVFGTSGKFANQEFIWMTQTPTQLVTYDGGRAGRHVSVQTYMGMFIDRGFVVRIEPRPTFPLDTQATRAATEAMIDRIFNTTVGGIIALGNTGPNNYM